MKWATAVIICLTLALSCHNAGAHQPRLVTPGKTTSVTSPQISQAFYAELQGQPDEYRLPIAQEMNLYLNILVPDMPERRTDFTVTLVSIDEQGRPPLTIRLLGARHSWEAFYEPFVGDRYYKGPETDSKIKAGTYKILVSNPDLKGKYVLAIGKKEKYTFAEAVQTMQRLPALKSYLGKSPWTAFFNLVGVFLLLALLLCAGVLYGLLRAVKRFRKKAT